MAATPFLSRPASYAAVRWTTCLLVLAVSTSVAWGQTPQALPFPQTGQPLPARAVRLPPVESALPTADVRAVTHQELMTPIPEPIPPGHTVRGVMLNEVISSTLRNDPKLRAGYQSIPHAQGDWITASLRPNPNLEVAQALLPLGGPFIPGVAEGGPPQLDVFVSYPIDWFLFGKRAAAMMAASRGVRISQSEYADLVRVRVAEAAVAYYDVLESQALVELANQDVENLQRVEAMTRLAIEHDARPRVELNRVRLDLLNAQQTLRTARQELIANRAQLRAIMGLLAADAEFEVGGSLDEPLAISPLPLEEALSIAQANRPDLSALRWSVSRARSEVDVQRRDAYPEVTPQAIYTRQFQEQAIAQPDAHSWGAGINLDMPLFNRNQGNRARAVAQLAQADYQLRAGLVDLRAELTGITVELETARANAESVAREQLQLAHQVRAAINQAYEAGARPLIDVLDAQRNYRETYRIFINSRAGYWRAVYRYYAALGRQVEP